MTYKAKVDWWLALVIVAGIAFPAISAMTTHQSILAVPPALLTLFLLVLVYPQTYKTRGDALRIRAGLTTRTIPWPSITKVSANEEPGVSMVLSTDRIVIHCPQLSRRGMGLPITIH